VLQGIRETKALPDGLDDIINAFKQEFVPSESAGE
jgi:hypothetical protein